MRTYTLAPMARPSVKLSFGQIAGFEAGWLPWPTPDALASTVRHWLRAQPRAAGSTRGDWQGRGLRGPWLVGLDAEARPMARWVPAPMDAFLVREDDGDTTWARHRLVPRSFPPGVLSDLPGGLMPLGLASGAQIGHAAPPLAWWRWEDMLRWLACPEDRDHVRPSALGLAPMNVTESGPMRWLPTPEDWRPTTGPVPVIPPPADGPRLDPRREATLRLSLGFAVDAQLDGAWLRVGADRQPFALDEDEGVSAGPSAALTPPAVRPAGGRVRVILLTPGAFAPVSVPCASRLEALGVRLVAAAVGQPLRATGWAEDDGPAQPCRRMAPAGSVYWLDVLDGDAEAWAERHQFESLCEQPQDRLDGLGQFVVGVA